MRRRLEGMVVVIVGASSGIGRATALALTDHRARLVVVGRDGASLATLVEECTARGGRAVAVTADIADHNDLERVRRRSIEEYGGIDTWVNSAAVIIAGHLEDQPIDEIERLVRTDVLGMALASRVALGQFREQGGGVLVNVSSLLGVVQNPLVPTYVMSKHAVRGLSLSLHHARTKGVRVCTVLPGPVDTPTFARAANHTGRELRAIPPACAPERAAAAIVACVRRPRRVRVVGMSGRALLLVHRFAPTTTETVAARVTSGLLLQSRPAPDGPGGIIGRPHAGQVHGGWRRSALRRRMGEALGRAMSRRGRPRPTPPAGSGGRDL